MYANQYRIWSDDHQEYVQSMVLDQDGTILETNDFTYMDVVGTNGDKFLVEHNTFKKDSKGIYIYEGDKLLSRGGDIYTVWFNQDKLVYQVGKFTFDDPHIDLLTPFTIVGNVHQGELYYP